jgi:hypothetical protein
LSDDFHEQIIIDDDEEEDDDWFTIKQLNTGSNGWDL